MITPTHQEGEIKSDEEIAEGTDKDTVNTEEVEGNNNETATEEVNDDTENKEVEDEDNNNEENEASSE